MSTADIIVSLIGCAIMWLSFMLVENGKDQTDKKIKSGRDKRKIRRFMFYFGLGLTASSILADKVF